MEKILYVYGYGSNETNSSTLNTIKEILPEFDIISIKYNQVNPVDGITMLEDYIEKNNIRYVIGHSLGGFITLCISSNVKKIVINPCLKPHLILPELSDSVLAEKQIILSKQTLADYEYLNNWLGDDNDTPLVNTIDNVMGIFSDDDELFSFKGTFNAIYPMTYTIHAKHRPEKKDFDKELIQKIKEFFS